jgi:hypothetical protein
VVSSFLDQLSDTQIVTEDGNPRLRGLIVLPEIYAIIGAREVNSKSKFSNFTAYLIACSERPATGRQLSSDDI